MSFLKKIIDSFKPNFYKEAAYLSVSEAIKYLFLFMLLVSLVISTYYVVNIRSLVFSFLKDEKQEIAKAVKDVVVPITIKEGIVSTKVKEPYVKTFMRKDKPDFAFIIDTKAETDAPLKDYENGVLLTKSNLIFKNKDGAAVEVKTYDLSNVKDFSIRPAESDDEYLIVFNEGKEYHLTHDFLIGWLKKLSFIGWPLLFIAVYIFGVIAKFIHVFIFSLFTLILNATSSKKLNYSNIFNIGVFAITVPTTIAVINIISGINLRFFALLYIFIYLLYLTLAFTYAKEKLFLEETKAVEGE